MRRGQTPEPACRVCGCTEFAACDEGCSWVRVEKGSPPLCSACSGTADDMAEAITRGLTILLKSGSKVAAAAAVEVGRAAQRRRKARKQLDAENLDPAWGGR